LQAWIDRLAAREGVKKGLEVPQPTQTNLSKEEEEKKAEEAKQWIHQK
jgi:glutathione S-transferase